MNGRMNHLLAAALVSICVGTAHGADKKDALPTAFPRVNLARNSQPRYAVINLDSLKKQVAYLLFDGDVTNVYKRVHVWSPGHKKYGSKPVSYKLDEETGIYFSVKSKTEVEKEGSITTWTIKYRTEKHGHTYKDYKTGEMVERETTLTPQWYFNVDLRRGPARHSERAGGKYPLDIGITGRMSVSDAWEKLPAVAEPWKYVYCSMSRSPTYDRKQGYLRCKGNLRYYRSRWNSFPITIRNLPDDSRVSVKIAPYLEAPIYSNDLTVAEIFLGHTDVVIPYGWYSVAWAFKSEFFDSKGLHQNSDSHPFAFSPPSK